MIRDYIRDQLANCVFASPNSYDEKTHTFIIPRYSKPQYLEGKCYIVKLQIQLLDSNSIIASNWNAGSIPPGQFLKIYISKTMGKMIYVDSTLYNIESQQDLNVFWSGWLPIEELEQIAQLN